MANEMRTFVTVVSKEPKVADKLKELFTPREGKYEADAVDLINRIKGTDYSYKDERENWDRDVDFPTNEEWDEVIGPKWLYVEYDHFDGDPFNCNIVLRTAWSVPIPFLNLLRNILQEIDPTCYIRGTYEDESYDPCGAFIYGENGYDDIEDSDEPFDWDEYEEDDFYLENYHNELHDLEESLVAAYLEDLEDRKNNPQHYE